MSAVPQPRAARASEPDPESGAEPSAASATPAEEAAESATGGQGAPSVVARPSSDARRAALRTLAVALPCGALGASLVLLAAGKTWMRGTAAFGQGHLAVHATGGQTTALPGALALVGLAALVAVFAVRRVGRYLVSALLTLSGLGVIVAVLARHGDTGAVDDAAATATGLTHATATHTAATSWPLVCALGGLLLLVAGLLALRYGHAWPAMSSRYDRAGGKRPARVRAAAAAPAVDPDRAEDLWKALDRGEDPTQGG